MSQAGPLDAESSNPQIPTTFKTNDGDAVPILNELELLGEIVPNAGIPFQSTGAGNVVTYELQYADETAVTDATKVGVAAFDSASFSVDANGFVTLLGGGSAVTSFDVQSSTAPGTDPVVPSVGGVVTVNGAAVANHSVVLESHSRAANTYNLEVQYATTSAVSDGTKSGVAHFDSTDFSVSAAGFVALAGAGAGQTITGDTGGALSPTAGNWNIITDNTTVKFAGATSTLTQDFGLTNLIMGSSATGITTATFSVGVGFEALDVLSSGLGNTAVGYHSCLAVTTAGSNTAVGQNSLLDDISSPGNTAIGHSSLVSLLSGDGSNTAIGINSGGSCATGTQNVFVGANSGSACNSSESSNILIKNIGAAAESNTIRIGTVGSGAGQQNRAFVAGITGVTVAGSAPVGVDTNGQLSSLGFGTAGQVLTSNGAATSPTFQTAASVAGSLRLIQTQTVSNVATVDFTNIGSYTTYMFLVQGAKPPSGNQILWLRVSTDNGSSFSTSGYAAGINYAVYNSATITNANSTAAVLVSGNAISSSSNFDADAIIYFYHANSAQNPHVSGVCKWVSSVPIGTMGDIQAGIAVTGVNAFRFMMDSGNITGTFSLYGIATS